MRVTRLAFKEIGPFEDAVFEMPEPEGAGELVLFEGPNGCGKTTIVEALSTLVGAFSPAEAAPMDRFPQRARSNAARIEARVFFAEYAVEIKRVRLGAGVE